jgi:hypothetical protein
MVHHEGWLVPVRRGLISVTHGAIAACICAVAVLSGCGIRPSGPADVAVAARAQAPAATPSAALAAAMPAESLSAVEATFAAAIEAVESFGSPPPAYQLSVQSAVSMRQPVPGFSQTLRSDLLSAGQAAILRYFGQPQAAVERRILAIAVAADVSPRNFSEQGIDLGTGVSRVAFEAEHVTAGAAVIGASVAAWSLSMTRKPGGQWQKLATVRVLRYTAAMRRAPTGQWQVVGLTLAAP